MTQYSMQEIPCQKLSELVSQYGPEICDDHRRLEALLKDVLSGEYRREIFLLVVSAREGIARQLMSQDASIPAILLERRLVRQLCDNLALEETSARWAVESWASALNVQNSLLSTMNKRERLIHSARQLISDKRLISFLLAAKEADCDVFAVELIQKSLSEGESLDEIFYDGGDYGYCLSVNPISGSDFKIAFGCQAGPCAGDGGEWAVSFDGDRVKSISSDEYWVS